MSMTCCSFSGTGPVSDLPTSDLPTSDLRPPTSDLRPPTYLSIGTPTMLPHSVQLPSELRLFLNPMRYFSANHVWLLRSPMRQYAIVSLSGESCWSSTYSFFRSAAGLNVPSSGLMARAHGTLFAPGIFPPRRAPSFG